MYSFNEFHALDEGKKKGLWANIHAKRKRGERPARPGEKDYPKTLNVEEVINEEDYDRMKDRRMERGGVGGNQRRFSSASSNKKHGTGKTALQKEMEKKHGKGATAMDIVKAEITAKYGKGAIKK